MARDRSADIEKRLETLDVSYFDEDPDDEVGRAGHGFYFQFAGEDDWNGSYGSEGEALDEATELVEAHFQELNDRLDRYSAPAADGLVRYLSEIEVPSLSANSKLYAWPTTDGRYLTLVDAKSVEHATQLVSWEFGVQPLRLEEHPITLDEFCADGVYPHPDPELPVAAMTP